LVLKNIVIDRPLAFLDLETTGTDAAKDRVVQVAVFRVSPPEQREAFTLPMECAKYAKLVNPTVPIPAEATGIHGITDAMIVECPTFRAIAAELSAFLDGCDLAGYNIKKYDLKVLCAEYRRCGAEFSLSGRRIADAFQLFRSRERRDLESAVMFYTGEAHDQAHEALSDAIASMRVLDAQVAKYGLPTSFDELSAAEAGDDLDISGMFVRNKSGGTPVFNFGKYANMTIDEVKRVNPGYLSWMLAQEFMDDTKEIVRQHIWR
jgi:DNA polymerase-3 subunit epsilon